MSSQLFGYSSSSSTSSSSRSSISSASTSPKTSTSLNGRLAGPVTVSIVDSHSEPSTGKSNSVDIESFAQLAISKEIMENTLKTLYNRRHSARQLSDATGDRTARGESVKTGYASGTRSGSITPFSSSEGTITPTGTALNGAGASLRISTTATTPLLHQHIHKRDSSNSSSSTLSGSLPSLAHSSNNTNHSANSSLSSTDFTCSSSSSLLTPTAYPSPSYTGNLNTPKTSFSTTTSASTTSSSYSNNSSVPNTAYSSLSSSSASFPTNNNHSKPTFTHFDYLSLAAPSPSSSSPASNTNNTAVSRPPLLRSVSEDVVVNHRAEFPLPGACSHAPSLPKGGGLPLTSNGRAFTTGSAIGKSTTRYRTQTVNSPLRSGASLSSDTDNDTNEASNGSTPLQTDHQGQTHTRTQSAAATSTVRGDQAASSMFDSYYGFEEHRRANTTGGSGSGYMVSLPSSQTQHKPTVDSFHLPPNFDQATAEAVRRAAAFVRSTTGGGARSSSPPLPPLHEPQQYLEESNHHARFHPHVQSSASMSNYAGMMGSCGNGYFGNAIRSKAMEILYDLLPGCTSAIEQDTISIVEYGSLNSLSASLVKPVIQRLREQKNRLTPLDHDDPPSWTITHSDTLGSDFRHLMKQQESFTSPHSQSDSCYINSAPNIFPAYTTKPFSSQIVSPRSVSVGWSLMDLHVRRTLPSKGVLPQAAAHSELIGFLQTRAKEFKKDGLLVLAFIQKKEEDSSALTKSVRQSSGPLAKTEDSDTPSFTSPLAGSKTPLPLYHPEHSANSSISGSVTAASSTIDSQASSTCTSISNSPAGPCLPTLDDTSNSFMRRSRSGSSPCQQTFSKAESTKKNDIWTAIPALLAPCIQRLVSTGLIKSDTAHQLLALPLHPRTPSQTQAVLRTVSQQWKVEWSCGLESEAKADSLTDVSSTTPTPLTPSHSHSTRDVTRSLEEADEKNNSAICEDALHLSHPAYTAFASTTLSRVQFAEHALQFVRVLYETHFRTVLRDQAKLSRSRVEEVLDSLNEVIREKIEEPNRAILALEMDVCMIALRRI